MGRPASPYQDPARAEAYGKRCGTTLAEERVVRRLLGGLPPPRIAVDVPCGNGRLHALLDGLGAGWVVGIDGAFPMAGRAASAGEAAAVGDAGALPLPDSIADLVLCVRLLHHFRDRAARVRILRELARVARGRVLFTFYRRWTLEGLRRRLRPKRPSTRIGLSIREVRRDLQDAGLVLERYASLLPLVREQTFVVAGIPRAGRPSGPGAMSAVRRHSDGLLAETERAGYDASPAGPPGVSAGRGG